MHQKPSVILAVIEAQILINVPFGKYRTNVYLAREMAFFPGSCPAMALRMPSTHGVRGVIGVSFCLASCALL